MMRCINCGFELEDGDKFCYKCGKSVNSDVMATISDLKSEKIAESKTSQERIEESSPDNPQLLVQDNVSQKLLCSNCGFKLEADDQFCYKCGTPVFKEQTNDDLSSNDDEESTEYAPNGTQVKAKINVAGIIVDDKLTSEDLNEEIADAEPAVHIETIGTEQTSEKNINTIADMSSYVTRVGLANSGADEQLIEIKNNSSTYEQVNENTAHTDNSSIETGRNGEESITSERVQEQEKNPINEDYLNQNNGNNELEGDNGAMPNQASKNFTLSGKRLVVLIVVLSSILIIGLISIGMLLVNYVNPDGIIHSNDEIESYKVKSGVGRILLEIQGISKTIIYTADDIDLPPDFAEIIDYTTSSSGLTWIDCEVYFKEDIGEYKFTFDVYLNDTLVSSGLGATICIDPTGCNYIVCEYSDNSSEYIPSGLYTIIVKCDDIEVASVSQNVDNSFYELDLSTIIESTEMYCGYDYVDLYVEFSENISAYEGYIVFDTYYNNVLIDSDRTPYVYDNYICCEYYEWDYAELLPGDYTIVVRRGDTTITSQSVSVEELVFESEADYTVDTLPEVITTNAYKGEYSNCLEIGFDGDITGYEGKFTYDLYSNGSLEISDGAVAIINDNTIYCSFMRIAEAGFDWSEVSNDVTFIIKCDGVEFLTVDASY